MVIKHRIKQHPLQIAAVFCLGFQLLAVGRFLEAGVSNSSWPAPISILTLMLIFSGGILASLATWKNSVAGLVLAAWLSLSIARSLTSPGYIIALVFFLPIAASIYLWWYKRASFITSKEAHALAATAWGLCIIAGVIMTLRS